ncbi:cytochrome P450 71A23 [Truncatella angustata]|uniref:Cytochrome P450 71A23 n=1 Tax=Truncatella angustata TaxID=152316 RepID=A0A9P8RGK5_9PEZI|nr:cytochrome P450 71A23 [Truncatella angustata]KAH6645624.1 cytochrome P450 71A23 [Truncatella angustata]
MTRSLACSILQEPSHRDADRAASQVSFIPHQNDLSCVVLYWFRSVHFVFTADLSPGSITSISNFALLGLAYVLFKIVYQIVYYRFLSPLAQFPGPFRESVTRLWIAYHNVKADEPEAVRELHQEHGPIIRITPTMLIVSDATKLPEIYSCNANKSKHYITGSFGDTESLFNMQDHKVHAQFRNIAASPYAFSNIKRMEPLIDANIEKWIGKLETLFAKDGKPFDFSPWAVYMAYDISSEVGFGAPFGFIEQAKDVEGLIQGFHDGLVPFGLMARLDPFTNWVKGTFLGKHLVASPEQESGIGTLMCFRDRLIKQHRVHRSRDDNGEPLDLKYIKAEILLVLLAGTDTTGTAFQAFMKQVMSRPNVYEKMMAEIDGATRAKKLSLCRNTTKSWNITIITSHGGLELFGMFVPEGTELTCNPWIVHRDTNIYGADADEYKPERWLDAEQAKLYNKYSMAFGYGARACLGKDIVSMELYKGPLQFSRAFRPNMVKPGTYVYKGGISYFEKMDISIERRATVI